MTALNQQQLAYLKAMGIQAWMPREAGQVVDEAEQAQTHVAADCGAAVETPKPAVGVSVPAVAQPDGGSAFNAQALWQDVQHDDWHALQSRVKHCTACDLHATRTQTVFGVGNEQADWLIIGEAPGADEDRQGEPFVGRAGQLLNNMLLAIGLRREQVYIANILKCRPPNNRDPRPEEVLQCEHYLRRQVELLQPKIILAVGRIAAQNLLKTDISLGRLRGKLHYYDKGENGPGTPVVITYHPAYLLRSPSEKRKAWQDLQFAVNVSQGTIPSS
jgi:uracil-DNA glycosylase family 4